MGVQPCSREGPGGVRPTQNKFNGIFVDFLVCFGIFYLGCLLLICFDFLFFLVCFLFFLKEGDGGRERESEEREH